MFLKEILEDPISSNDINIGIDRSKYKINNLITLMYYSGFINKSIKIVTVGLLINEVDTVTILEVTLNKRRLKSNAKCFKCNIVS